MDRDRDEVKVLLFTPERIIYEGRVSSLVLPGERGVFEVLPHHKKLLSRLIGGYMIFDGRHYKIKRGVVKVGENQVVAIVEDAIKHEP